MARRVSSLPLLQRNVLRTALALATPLVAGAGCGTTEQSPNVAIATNLALPRGLLDHVTKLTLSVTEGAVTCDASTGQLTFPNGTAGAREILKKALGTTGCADNARFCGDVTIDKSDAMRVFAATATGDGDTTLAIGCTQAKVDQDQLPLSIKMVRFLAPAVCGDGTIQPTEQCEPGGTLACDDDCQSKEVLLSTGSSQNGTTTGGSGDKSSPFFLWPAQTGTNGRFVAFFTDRATGSANNEDIGLRVMGDDLAPLTSPPALAAGSIFLPNGTTFPPPVSSRQQSNAQATFLKGKYYVVFQDDNSPSSNGLDIHLRSMDTTFVADQAADTPLGVNGPDGAGEAKIQSSPAVASGPEDRLFVAWEDEGQGKIAGRTIAPPNTLGNQNDISSGTGNTHVSVAATSNGWVAVWQSGTGIKLRAINADGTPQGAEQIVNESSAPASEPRVASLDGGRFAVVFVAGGDVFIQRYDERGSKIAGDQSSALNDLVTAGDQLSPAIASSPAAGGSYAVAWVDAPSKHVNARFVGGTSGFLFNNVNGQSSEFQASRVDGRNRVTPTVAIGGAGPFVAIGWEDKTTPSAGIVVRRFPVPTE
ncbi:Putative hemagglutinin/hemolysin-related protein [Labilithrix luteola]|uniref:Putative hemagglutinin/hemolysin-related protein n=1 Tax=Labilithrix luteola TaxID=1391654 RepID=A0A0K1Q8L2_9BACT|nr:hypothetical protein [Labilithrix luteola]AKV01720.1 Putative hemagglutinin/hemolysin-related protein [Labilithrix luteola]